MKVRPLPRSASQTQCYEHVIDIVGNSDLKVASDIGTRCMHMAEWLNAPPIPLVAIAKRDVLGRRLAQASEGSNPSVYAKMRRDGPGAWTPHTKYYSADHRARKVTHREERQSQD